MLNLNQPSLQLFFVITFIKVELIVDPKYFLFGADFPAIEVDIELGCVKLPEVTTPTPSRRTTGSLIIPRTLLHLLILQLSLASLPSQTEPQTHVR